MCTGEEWRKIVEGKEKERELWHRRIKRKWRGKES